MITAGQPAALAGFSVLRSFPRWGAPMAIGGYSSGFRPPNLPALAWQDTGDISAQVFFMSEPSVWRSLVETATSIKGQATR